MGKHSVSDRLAVSRPTWGADRNRPLAGQIDPAVDEMLLPQFDDGITLLDVEGDCGIPIPQSLMLDHLLLRDGPIFQVNTNGHATTTTLSQIAPSQRLLNQIHMAHSFAIYQHRGAVCDLLSVVDKVIQMSTTDAGTTSRGEPNHSEDMSPHTSILIVTPTIDVQYCADDTLGETHAKTLQARTLARLATYTGGYDIPVPVTRNEWNGFAEPVATIVDHHLECEQTRMDPRVIDEDFETPIYSVDDSAYYQTALAYRRQLLVVRATQVGVRLTTPTPSTPTPEGVGTGVTADGEMMTTTADPSLDAWTVTGIGD